MPINRREGTGWLRSKSLRRGREGGVSVIEVVISMSLVSIMGIGMISGGLTARSLAEYDKQRIAATAIARDYLEQYSRYHSTANFNPVTIALDNFNTPDTGDDLQATMQLQEFDVNSDCSQGGELSVPRTDSQRIMVQATVSWNRTGSLKSHRVSLTLSTYVVPLLFGQP